MGRLTGLNKKSNEKDNKKNQEEDNLEILEKRMHVSVPAGFHAYAWPRFLQQCIDCGHRDAQRDVLWLSSLAVLGATTTPLLDFYYGGKTFWPNLQLFVVAPAASGKGVMNWAYHLAMPLHQRYKEGYDKQVADYKAAHEAWNKMGKKRAKVPEPEQPKRRLFYIPGNNTGTGLLENIADSDGRGCIFTSEADEVIGAIKGHYGHWSNVLRKVYDHDMLSYNRRQNREYREVECTWVSVVMSGTPGQVKPLIPSPENGLFSRQLFYCMRTEERWRSQFDANNVAYSEYFRQWGERWNRVMEDIQSVAYEVRLGLTEEQEDLFDRRMSTCFHFAMAFHGEDGMALVKRLAVNTLRLVAMVAWLRALDDWLMEEQDLKAKMEANRNRTFLKRYHSKQSATTRKVVIDYGEESAYERRIAALQHLAACPGLAPMEPVADEEARDGAMACYRLTVSDEDLQAVLDVAERLCRHSIFMMTTVYWKKKNPKRKLKPVELFMRDLPLNFTLPELEEMAKRCKFDKYVANRAIKWLLSRKDVCEVEGEPGRYEFSSSYIGKD
jgi:hypothetical protein